MDGVGWRTWKRCGMGDWCRKVGYYWVDSEEQGIVSGVEGHRK
jgi:hypothetical protein